MDQHDFEMRRNLADMRGALHRLLSDLDAIEAIGGVRARAALVRLRRDAMHAQLDRAAVSLGKAAQDAQDVK